MANTIPLNDAAPVYGMNTYDDPKTLKHGECVELINGTPGNPPIPRGGMIGAALESTSGWNVVPSAISFLFNSLNYVAFWKRSVADPISYKLVMWPAETTGAIADEILLATFVTSVASTTFSFCFANGNLYAFFSDAPTSINGRPDAIGPIVVELSGSKYSVRQLSTNQKPQLGITAVASGTGQFVTGNCVSYAVTYVRLDYIVTPETWQNGTPESTLIIPASVQSALDITSVPTLVTTQVPVTMEGLEDPTARITVDFSAQSNVRIRVSGHNYSAHVQGATHFRVWRSRVFTGTDRVANAKAATHYYLMDIPILTIPVSPGYLDYTDTVTDAAIEAAGTAYQLTAFDYTQHPVPGPWSKVHKNRLWLFNNGTAYCSEAPGGDGGTQNVDAYAFPTKWFGWFKPTELRMNMDREDGIETTGIGSIGSDLFFFKKSKIFAIYNGDPTSAPQDISKTIGCPFPHTITEADVPGYLGKCILFLSNYGPAAITEGGHIRLLTEFKIKELWPDKSSDLFEDNRGWIVNNCSAAWFKSSWHVMWKLYGESAGYWFALYVDPNIEKNPNASIGAWKVEYAGV